jgi:succinate dehydrogenase/fumarate reductase flavoprotein subunit
MKDLMMNHTLIEGTSPAHFRSPDSMNDRGGLVVDWDLRTTLEGLYAAGEQMFSPATHGYAASTGRYAGRKAAACASQASQPAIARDQIVREKTCVYAPIKRKEGIQL